MIECWVRPDGTKYWYNDGKKHREDGPAIEHHDGSKWWYLNGMMHRENGPAVIDSDGTKYWYKNGLRHREDGPAVEWSTGRVEYWLDDVQVTRIELFIKFGVVNV